MTTAEVNGSPAAGPGTAMPANPYLMRQFVCLAAGDPLRRPSAVRSFGCVDGAAFAGVMSTGLLAMSILPQERQGPSPVHPERV